MAEEKKAYEADTGELDIDMGEHEAAEVEIDEPQREDQDDGDDGSEHDDVMNSAQKRINRLTKKMRDAERQREEAVRYAQQVQQEAEQLKQRMKQLDTGYLQEYGSRLELETKTAEAELKRAVEIGDSDKIISSQRRLNELYSAAQKYRDAQRMQETREQQYAAQQQAVRSRSRSNISSLRHNSSRFVVRTRRPRIGQSAIRGLVRTRLRPLLPLASTKSSSKTKGLTRRAMSITLSWIGGFSVALEMPRKTLMSPHKLRVLAAAPLRR
jgi:hypothetical protein